MKLSRHRIISILLAISLSAAAITGCSRSGLSSSESSSSDQTSSSISPSESREESDVLNSSDAISSEDAASIASGTSSRETSSKTSGSSSANNVSSNNTGNQTEVYPTVKEDEKLLQGLIAGWNLNEGKGSIISDANKGSFKGNGIYTVWLNDTTFGKVLDFSTEKSLVEFSGQTVTLGNEFTIAAWMKAPPRENDYRIILSQGANGAEDYWDMKLEKDGTFSFYATALKGTDSSGVKLNDGKWHHTSVTLKGGKLTYYIDKKAVKTVTVSGTIPAPKGNLILGAGEAGTMHFDGSLSRVRIFKTAKTPNEITSIAVPNSGNEMKTPTFHYNHGIVIDRPQRGTIPPPMSQQITSEDVTFIKNMGFDHIKAIFTPSYFMNADGSVNQDTIWYVKAFVDLIVEQDMPCLICIHPEADFKETYLGNLDNFEIMLKFYEEFALFIGENWTEKQVAFQLMTEPFANVGDWTYMSDRMWGTVRNVLPYHTLITSSDKSGNMERLKLMSPTSDSNLIYSFTTYEPYAFGFNSGSTAMNGVTSFWNYLSEIPWPASPSVIEANMDRILAKVPDSMKNEAKAAMIQYGKGDSYGLYNREWHFARARSLYKWSQKYGGSIHLQCVEFGALDAVMAKRFGQTDGVGITNAARLQYIKDIRESFETYHIGWSYWSYNETFTVLNTENRQNNTSPVLGQDEKTWYDRDMLRALSVTPLV